MEKLIGPPPEPAFKAVFEKCDVNSKGYLTKEEFHQFCAQLASTLKPYADFIKSFSDYLERVPDFFTYPFLCESWEKLRLVQAARKLSSPAVKFTVLLKELKEAPMVPHKPLIEEYADKLAHKQIYGEASDAQLVEALPKLLESSITLNDLEPVSDKIPAPVPSEKLVEGTATPFLDKLAAAIKANPELVEKIDTPDFSPFEWVKVVDRKWILPLMAYHVCIQHDLFSVLDKVAFEAFIQKIQAGYKMDNFFHNDLHAADIVQMCHYMITQGGIKEVLNLEKQDIAGLMIAAIVHDYKHPALTNGFLQNSGHELAILYNDQAILENFHISESFKLILRNPECNIFGKDKPWDQLKSIRKRIIECVLSTDMARHFDIVNALQNLITTHQITKGTNNEKVVNKKTPATEFDSKQFILGACIHATDIGNPARPFHIAEEWTVRVMEEFWRQGDMEKKMKLPVSFLCDRATVKIPQAQVGFITGLVKPLFEKMTEIFPKLQPLLINVQKTEDEWRKRAAAPSSSSEAKKI